MSSYISAYEKINNAPTSKLTKIYIFRASSKKFDAKERNLVMHRNIHPKFHVLPYSYLGIEILCDQNKIEDDRRRCSLKLFDIKPT